MNTTLIAGLVLLAGAGFLLWKGKAAAGVELAKMFSEKKVLLIEFTLFGLIFLHAHTAAELAVKQGWDYEQRFLVHSFVNFFSFLLAMGLYKNGKDLGSALQGSGRLGKELLEVLMLLVLTLSVQWFSLWMMCVGFGKPYIAFLKSSGGEYVGFVGTFSSMTDFMLATSIVIIVLEAASALALVILGSASAEVKAGTTKSGGMLSGLASMFGGMFKPTQPKSAVPKTDDLAKDICRIMGRPDTAITAVSRELDRSPNKRKVLSGLVSDFNTAAGFEKHNIKSQIQNVIEQ